METQKTCPNCGASECSCVYCGTTIGFGKPAKAIATTEKTATILCPKCGKTNPQENEFCQNCGQEFVVLCYTCNTKYSLPIKHCPKCGRRLQTTKEKNLTLTVVFLLLLPVLFFHVFPSIFYLLFTNTPITSDFYICFCSFIAVILVVIMVFGFGLLRLSLLNTVLSLPTIILIAIICCQKAP